MSHHISGPNSDTKESKVQENIANWQSANDPLAPLSDDQVDLVYELGDLISKLFNKSTNTTKTTLQSRNVGNTSNVISKTQDYIQWMISVEKDMKHEHLKLYQNYYELLSKHNSICRNLFACSNDALESLNDLKGKYKNVTEKTNYLHDLSEQLMAHQRILKKKKTNVNDKLKYFTSFSKCQENIERLSQNINSPECVHILDNIDESISYLNEHLQFKESRIYKMKYESLLNTLLNKIYDYVNNVIIETTQQVVNPDFKGHILPQAIDNRDSLVDSAFSLYYGKFQSVSTKVKFILSNLEEREDQNDQYKNVTSDCQKTYLTQRLPIISIAVSKALCELKDKHKNDHSVLFRACSLFIMKVCQDEANCYNYFFNKISSQLNDYLGSLCQYQYDILRPSLITINHIEVLSELCGILKGEMLNDKVIDNEQLTKYVEVIKQLLQDVEERLVFRANVFFHHDISGYKPSPGDLAYPEKLEQMENIALEMKDKRSDSRASVVSLDSQEVANINVPQMAHFHSYTDSTKHQHGIDTDAGPASAVIFCTIQKENILTRKRQAPALLEGISPKQRFLDITNIEHLPLISRNSQCSPMTVISECRSNSPADLHGMWYPTVKRTLVCLSRLYFCLDRDTFQGLAQEALTVCIRTVQSSSDQISSKKTPVDGQLFQIKHLLIIREQIAPFQVDFTVKEMALDFSTVQKAAIDLIHHRNNIFTFGSNNALLEFLLEGTPKVKEYLVDSRKEIDKQLKHSCEAFISHVTNILIGNILKWIEKAEHILKIIQVENAPLQELTVSGQDFGKPNVIGAIIKEVQKNIKGQIPVIQRSMQLYLANRETEFILFRPIKNNIINAFMQLDQIIIKGGYNNEDQLLIACPSPEQVNILLCSVSLTSRQDNVKSVL